MLGTDNLHLAPPLVEAGKFDELAEAGQTISSAFCPSDNSLLVYVKDAVSIIL